jgi:hypothetical protein
MVGVLLEQTYSPHDVQEAKRKTGERERLPVSPSRP